MHLVKIIMDKLKSNPEIDDELERFITKEVLKTAMTATKPEVTKPVQKPKPVQNGEKKVKRKLTSHNIKVSENIPYIKNLHKDIAHKFAFSLAATMSRYERSMDPELPKAEALGLAICEYNQKHQTIVLFCKCMACREL